MLRFALLSSPEINVDVVKQYLPSNYHAVAVKDDRQPPLQLAVLIVGHDSRGWTLDDYVIPRLASGMIYAKELFLAENAIEIASGLKSEQGENPEYDRALVELTCELMGLSITDNRETIADTIGIVKGD